MDVADPKSPSASRRSFNVRVLPEVSLLLNRQAAVLNRMWCRRIALCTRVTRLPSSLLEDLKDLSGFFLGSDGSRPQNDDKLPELRIRAVAMLAWFFFRSYFRQPRPDSLHEMRVNPLVSHIVRSAYLSRELPISVRRTGEVTYCRRTGSLSLSAYTWAICSFTSSRSRGSMLI